MLKKSFGGAFFTAHSTPEDLRPQAALRFHRRRSLIAEMPQGLPDAVLV